MIYFSHLTEIDLGKHMWIKSVRKLKMGRPTFFTKKGRIGQTQSYLFHGFSNIMLQI